MRVPWTQYGVRLYSAVRLNNLNSMVLTKVQLFSGLACKHRAHGYLTKCRFHFGLSFEFGI